MQQNQRNRTAGTGRFQNLQRFMEANQDTSGQMASKIGESISSPLEQAKKDVQTIGQQYQQQGTQEKERIAKADPLSKEATSNPIGFQGEKTKLDAFKQLREGQFQNINAADYTNVNKQIAESQGGAKDLMSQQGRFKLLDRVFNNPEYSQGAKRIDQMLLQTNMPALQRTATGVQTGATQALGTIDANEAMRQQLQNEIATGASDAQRMIMDRLTAASEGIQYDVENRFAKKLDQQNAFNRFLAGQQDMTFDEFLQNYDMNAFGDLSAAQQDSMRTAMKLREQLGGADQMYDRLVEGFRSAPGGGAYNNLATTAELAAMKAAGQETPSGIVRENYENFFNDIGYMLPQRPSGDDLRAIGLTGDFVNDALRSNLVVEDYWGGTTKFDPRKFADEMGYFLTGNRAGLDNSQIFNKLRNAIKSDTRRTVTDNNGARMVVDNLMKYVTGPTQVSRENVALADEASRLMALNELANQDLRNQDIMGAIDLERAKQEQLDRVFGTIDYAGLNRAFGGRGFENV